MSATDTLTWQIREAFKTALSEITQANGYRTDIGQQVHLEATDVPADTSSVLITMPSIQANTDLSISKRQRSASLDIEASVPADWSDANKVIDAALNDIEKAITQSRDNCLAPVGVTDITLNEADMPQLVDGAEAATGTWNCTITYINSNKS